MAKSILPRHCDIRYGVNAEHYHCYLCGQEEPVDASDGVISKAAHARDFAIRHAHRDVTPNTPFPVVGCANGR